MEVISQEICVNEVAIGTGKHVALNRFHSIEDENSADFIENVDD